jgi:hypothetical protein
MFLQGLRLGKRIPPSFCFEWRDPDNLFREGIELLNLLVKPYELWQFRTA